MIKHRAKYSVAAALVILVSATVALWQLSSIRKLDSVDQSLTDLKDGYAELKVTVLNLFFGRQNNYDYLNQAQSRLDSALVEVVGHLESRRGTREHQLAVNLENSFLRTNRRLENFKSLDSISRNSKRFLTGYVV